MRGVFFKQTWALTKKTLLIAVGRHWLSTLLRGILLPVAFVVLLANLKNFIIARNGFGFSSTVPVASLADSVGANQKFVVVQPPGLGADVARVVDTVVNPLRSTKKQLVFLSNEDDLVSTCVESIQGNSDCFAAIVFNDSPLTLGKKNAWNYTVRTDAALTGTTFHWNSHNTDEERVYLPLQVAVDNAITNSTLVPNEFFYSSISQATQDSSIRNTYISLIISTYGIVFFISLVPEIYHLVGMISTERESGMSALVDSMGGSAAARVCGYILAFDLIYLPTWIAFGIIIWKENFPHSNGAVLVFWQIFNGMAITSASVFAASFFRTAQLSGAYAAIGFLIVAVAGQIIDHGNPSTGEVAILSLLFPGMAYMFLMGYVGRYEQQALPTNLIHAAPNTSVVPSTSRVSGILLLIFLVLQIFIYPALAILVETWFHGARSRHRKLGVNPGNETSPAAIQISKLTKIYSPSIWQKWFTRRKSEDFVAVDSLSFTAEQGQILCLLGANGSGKTTTLDMIGGLQEMSSGEIYINAKRSQLGICPQRNVLWDELTVEEHVRIWNEIKCAGDTVEARNTLIEACDLVSKKHAFSKTLSGGQKRKLQLACMYVGGSKVCLLDEVSSGLDPLSRRVIWNIILAERGKRSMVLTTHFLDEVDVLSDHIVMISDGSLKCEGSAVELKTQLGGGYRVHMPGTESGPNLELKYPVTRLLDQTVYKTPDSAAAAQLIEALEQHGHSDVFVNGPTVEDVFLKVVHDAAPAEPTTLRRPDSRNSMSDGMKLSSGQDISFYRQTAVLFRKRLSVLHRNWLPYFFAVAMPIAVTPAVYTLIANLNPPNCSGVVQVRNLPIPLNLRLVEGQIGNLQILAGPTSINSTLHQVISSFPIGVGLNMSNYTNQFVFEDSYAGLLTHLNSQFTNITPGALYMDSNTSAPTYAYISDFGTLPAMVMQNLWTQIRTGLSVAVSYAQLDSLIPTIQGNIFEYITFFCLAQAVYPAFFSLYPTFERLRKVRALQYSNGVRARPLWFSYTMFDFMFVLVIAAACSIIFAQQTNWWFAVGYMFPILALYGLAATLMAYVISLFATSQLAAFALTAGSGAIMFLLSLLTFILVQTYTATSQLQNVRDATTFTLNLIFPIGNVVRAMTVGANVFRINCRNNTYISSNSIFAYGGPILYLIIQVCFLSFLLLWLERGGFPSLFKRRDHSHDAENELRSINVDVEDEKMRVQNTSTDPLRILEITKRYGSNLAVDQITFGVSQGEVFALLGPNGAGKTTTIDMIRGESKPDEGTILLNGMDIVNNMRMARKHLGVCPQFDALDLLTTREHLEFYARAKGVPSIEDDVNTVMKKVGLDIYAARLASKLSGGNKRKLSLAIALLGNPTVLVLDEPSSSMDAASKRVMWQTLSDVTAGRSLLLTTHSMEEADALATRAAIISRRILAIGTTKFLREKYGNAYHVHVVLKSAPASSREEMDHVEEWIKATFAGVSFDAFDNLHGQIKFSVPAVTEEAEEEKVDEHPDAVQEVVVAPKQKKSLARALFSQLEAHKDDIGLRFYSVSAATLDQVFLKVVTDNNIREE